VGRRSSYVKTSPGLIVNESPTMPVPVVSRPTTLHLTQHKVSPSRVVNSSVPDRVITYCTLLRYANRALNQPGFPEVDRRCVLNSAKRSRDVFACERPSAPVTSERNESYQWPFCHKFTGNATLDDQPSLVALLRPSVSACHSSRSARGCLALTTRSGHRGNMELPSASWMARPFE